ncbi:MAG: dephospho-CoA kinase [Alistipes sp.]|jgi:dephospho-CoA kinase|nr:dephospho-CoA kinase [Alistipes sp.]
MYKVGLTGGIGSGKSKVAEFLRDREVAIYDSDSRAKELMMSNEALREALIAEFGQECYTADGINRAWLAQRVFNNEAELARLNAIVHPAVMRDFAAWAEAQEGNYVVLESAILLEAGLESHVDVVVAVMAPKELRLERAMLRDGAKREQIEERMRNQMSDEERTDRAKYAIVNIDLEELEEDVEQLHRRLCYDSKPHNNCDIE